MLPEFRGESSLSTWIYPIATNLSFDHFRGKTNRQSKATLSLDELEFDGAWIVDPAAASPEQLTAQSEMSGCVQDFIPRLPSDYRAALLLHDLKGLKNREIADVLDIPISTVKMRLHRARIKLREVLNIRCNLAHDERNVFVCEKKMETREARK